jgi:hypothetical protein
VTDWESLTELVSQLGLLVDARDWPRLQELFTDQVDVDYSSLNGGVPELLSAADLIAGWRDNLSRLRATHHVIANHAVAITGDRATVAANVTATHVSPSQTGSPLWTVGGRYDVVARRTGGEWRIAGLTLTVRWASGNQAIMAPR